MAIYCSNHVPLLRNPSSSSSPLLHSTPTLHFFHKFSAKPQFIPTRKPHFPNFTISCTDQLQTSTNSLYQETENAESETESTEGEVESTEYETESTSEYETEEEGEYDSSGDEYEGKAVGNGPASLPTLLRQRRRYRKQYPGEKEGITEEMRFVAMKLRNDGPIKKVSEVNGSGDDGKNRETWEPTVEGFLKYLVDSQLVFNAIERIVDESTDVSYVYFRKTGLERSVGLSNDLEWFKQQGHVIPAPSKPGITYVKYLEELVEKSPMSFLCHFYNIYFSHITGGQVISKQVSGRILEGREMEFYTWNGDPADALKSVRENLNAVAEYWSRDEKNKCLRETTKAFRFMGQIVRLIIII